MPALFVYLIAVGLLLGGGYGALSWLAAPEPVKIVVKARPRPPPHYEARSETTPLETSGLAVDANDHIASVSSNPPSPSLPEPGVAASEQGAQAQASGLAQAQQRKAANAEVSPAEARLEAGEPAPAVSPVSASIAQPAAPAAPATAVRPAKRPPPHPRQARSRSEKPALALMTLRTIEYGDGRRVTRLIPYRSPERALAFRRDE